jgi:hypothetical protein
VAVSLDMILRTSDERDHGPVVNTHRMILESLETKLYQHMCRERRGGNIETNATFRMMSGVLFA